MSPAAPWRVALVSGAFSACVALGPIDPRLGALVAALTCIVISVLLPNRRAIAGCAAIAACCLGAWRGASAFAADHGTGSVAGHLGFGTVVLRGTVGDAGVPGRVDTIVVDVHELATPAGTWTVTGAVVVEPLHAVDVLPGDVVDVSATSLRAPAQRPGSLSAVALERVGVTAIAAAAQVTPLRGGGPSLARLAQQARRTLTATVTRALPEPEATLLLGVAFGIHGTLPSDVRTPLQDAGLIHIVAVSGLKVVMVAALVSTLGRLRGWSRRRRLVATLVVMSAYVILAGAGAAALRSSVMVAAGLLLSRDGRRPHSFALLGLCAAMFLAIDPPLATDVGFQLSFLGTAGILLVAAPIAARIDGPRLLVEPFAVTVAAQLATAPVAAGTFGVLSLVGPFTNALVLPLLPVVMVVGGLGAILGTIAPAFGWLPLEMAAMSSRVILAVAQGASSLPLAAVPVQLWPVEWTVVEIAALVAGGMAWLMHTRRHAPTAAAAAIAVAAALVAGTASTAVASAVTGREMRVTVLDVGNGVAVLVQPPGGGTVLVDGGSDGVALLGALGRELSPFERHLDAVVLTATDRATAAAIASLLGHYDVGTVVLSQPLPPALQTVTAGLVGAGTRVVVAGAASWTLGGVLVRCTPSGPAPASPCVLQLRAGPSTALVTGNLAQAVQDEVAAVQGPALRADLLVGPTTTAPSAMLLAAVRPSLIAVPARRSPPGLGTAGVTVAVTGHDGDLPYIAAQAVGGFTSPGG